ncbi:unnamed protein product [Arabidopsis halleri]
MLRNAVKLLHRGNPVSEKEFRPWGGMKKIGEKTIAIFYHLAIGGFGFGAGALSTNHLAQKLKQQEQEVVTLREELDEVILPRLPEELRRIAK